MKLSVPVDLFLLLMWRRLVSQRPEVIDATAKYSLGNVNKWKFHIVSHGRICIVMPGLYELWFGDFSSSASRVLRLFQTTTVR